MSVSLEVVTQIARAIAAEQSREVEVITVASANADAERVELLVTVAGCHADPCQLLLNVSRSEPHDFERQLRAKLKEALAVHRSQR